MGGNSSAAKRLIREYMKTFRRAIPLKTGILFARADNGANNRAIDVTAQQPYGSLGTAALSRLGLAAMAARPLR